GNDGGGVRGRAKGNIVGGMEESKWGRQAGGIMVWIDEREITKCSIQAKKKWAPADTKTIKKAPESAGASSLGMKHTQRKVMKPPGSPTVFQSARRAMKKG